MQKCAAFVIATIVPILYHNFFPIPRKIEIEEAVYNYFENLSSEECSKFLNMSRKEKREAIG